MNAMKHALIAVSIVAPWVIGLLAVGRYAGWNVFTRVDVRTQADRMRAFGAR
jgi:hypothetical protein